MGAPASRGFQAFVSRGDLFQGFSGEATDSLIFVEQGIQQKWYGLGEIVAEEAQRKDGQSPTMHILAVPQLQQGR